LMVVQGMTRSMEKMMMIIFWVGMVLIAFLVMVEMTSLKGAKGKIRFGAVMEMIFSMVVRVKTLCGESLEMTHFLQEVVIMQKVV